MRSPLCHREPPVDPIPGGRNRWLVAALLVMLAWSGLGFPSALDAQDRSGAAAPGAARGIRFERLTVEDGLSQGTVTCILQDRTGFLWLGTHGGLNRYDGYRFEVYRHQVGNPESLPHDWILTLAEDPSGDLWAGTEGGGLARWRRASDSFSSYRHDPADLRSLSGHRVIGLAWAPDGFLWTATIDAGLSRFDPERETFEHWRHDPADPGSLAHDQLGAVLVDRRGTLWVGTWGGLDRYDPARQAFDHFTHDPADPRSLSDNRVRAILEDRRGDLWIGTPDGLNRLDPKSGQIERFRHGGGTPAAGSLSHNWVRALFEDRDGRLWIGTDGGLNLWHEASQRFVSYHPEPGNPHSLASDQILALSQDRAGVLWISAVGAGLNKWDPRTWAFGHLELGAAGGDGQNSNVFAISEDRQGRVWLGTFGDGLWRIGRDPSSPGDPARFRHDPRDPSSLADDRVTALLHDRDGVLWVGTLAGGLQRFEEDPGRPAGRFERFQHDPQRAGSLSSDSVAALHQDRQGRLWVATYGGGLNRHRGDGTFTSFVGDPGDPQSLSDDRAVAFAEDAEGHLWVATDGGGLNRFHPVTEAFLRIGHDPAEPSSLASNDLTALHVDDSGRLWVGTKGSGLDRLERIDGVSGLGRFEHYSPAAGSRAASGLPDRTIWGIRSDGSGGLWVTTNNGLARLDPETGDVDSYNVSHGLQANEFNLGAHYRSPSGELFFGGVNGVNAFFPERVGPNPYVPPVVLTAFTKINQPVRFERPLFDVERISLNHRDYSFSFEFAALDFTAPHLNRYRYTLEGLDQGWIDNGDRRWVSFTNLDPGRYVLRVQGSNSDGMWSEEGASIAIEVAPPPWRTRWAYALYALAVAMTAWIGGQVLSQRRQAERDRLIAERDRAIAEHEHEIAERDRERLGERERLIGERERLIGEREQLIAELEASNAELERFNYTVSHDLKSPLLTIRGFIGLLRSDLDKGERERVDYDLDRITRTADKMAALLDDLLELSRLHYQEQPSEEMDLDEVVAEAVELVQGLIDERGCEVRVEPGLPVVAGDRQQLVSVYQNLLANAVRYMGDQEYPRVEVGLERQGEQEILFVRDNGSGIEERFHQQIFGLFERLSSDREGSGVGLTLVRRIIEKHGGRVWVESEGEGRGSTFRFTLAPAPDSPAP